MENHYSEKLEELLEKEIKEEKIIGDEIRNLTRIIANDYSENPEKLEKLYNHPNKHLAGMATSAYHFLTGDIDPIGKIDFGGFGAIIDKSEAGLEFNRNQLFWYAEISKRALEGLKISGLRPFWHSDIIGYALRNAINTGSSFWFSNLRDGALEGSVNSEHALGHAVIIDKALRKTYNKGYALKCARVSGDALGAAVISDYALRYSEVSGDALKNTRIRKCALGHSVVSEHVLEHLKRSLFNGIFVRLKKE